MADTETNDPRYVDIDAWPTLDAVGAMLEGQIAAVQAIKAQAEAIAAASEAAALRLQEGGRLVYTGAGTSGRIAVLDGVELGPTFNWPEAQLLYLMAGGDKALLKSVEGAEDDGDAARSLIARHQIGRNDVVIGIAASGRTPFTVSAIEAACAAGALTIGVANNPGTHLLAASAHAVCIETGAELIAGSTRMKAGTAQKIVVNLLSTAIMLRLGRVYKGLMVDMVISNAKLLRRAQRIVERLTACSEAEAIAAIDAAGRDIKVAVLIALGQSPSSAKALLAENGGRLRKAVDALEQRP